jgi:hypothetical protein
MTSDSAEAAAVALLISRLHDKFPQIPISTVQQIVAEVYASYSGCRVREFIPLLVERESRERLRALPRPDMHVEAHVAGQVNGTVRTPTHALAPAEATR